MNTKDSDGFYKVRVTDYAIPAFCDSEVNYYDTSGNIRRLYEQSLNGQIREEAERCLAAMEEYLFCNAWNCKSDIDMDGVWVDAVCLEDPAPVLPARRLIAAPDAPQPS